LGVELLNPLLEIAKKIGGSHCERLVKQTGSEVTVAGASLGVASFKIDVGNYSNKIVEFYKVPQIMVALDNTQYLLCGATSYFKENQSLREDCLKMRMQLIYAFGQLQALLCIPNSEELSKELTKWVRFMNKLNKQSIEFLKPGPKLVQKGETSELSKIMSYQGLLEEHMQEAIKLLK
jgi:hypothetical protein